VLLAPGGWERGRGGWVTTPSAHHPLMAQILSARGAGFPGGVYQECVFPEAQAPPEMLLTTSPWKSQRATSAAAFHLVK